MLYLQQSASAYQGTGGNPNSAGFQDHVMNVYEKQIDPNTFQKIFVDITFGSDKYTNFETYLNNNTYITDECGCRFDANGYKLSGNVNYNSYPNQMKYKDLFEIRYIQ